MVDEKKLTIWWSSLTIAQKERIATKIACKGAGGKIIQVYYPECSEMWNALPLDKKQAIYDHCTDAHGYLLHEWKDGRPFS